MSKKNADLAAKSATDLKDEETRLRKELFDLEFKHSTRQLGDTMSIRRTRRQLARAEAGGHGGQVQRPAVPGRQADDGAGAGQRGVEELLQLRGGQRAAGVPVEAHLYEKGGHGFGVGNGPDHPAAGWTDIFDRWITRQLAG